MLKLKLQYFGHLMRRADSLEKIPQCWERLKVKGEEGDRIKCLDGITDSMDINLSKLWDKVKDREAWHVAVHGVTKNRTRLSEQQQNTELNPTDKRETQQKIKKPKQMFVLIS